MLEHGPREFSPRNGPPDAPASANRVPACLLRMNADGLLSVSCVRSSLETWSTGSGAQCAYPTPILSITARAFAHTTCLRAKECGCRNAVSGIAAQADCRYERCGTVARGECDRAARVRGSGSCFRTVGSGRHPSSRSQRDGSSCRPRRPRWHHRRLDRLSRLRDEFPGYLLPGPERYRLHRSRLSSLRCPSLRAGSATVLRCDGIRWNRWSTVWLVG
jgi:hypothetical protein